MQRTLRKGKTPRLAKGEFPLKGVLVCGECGRKITASYSRGNGGKYGYYHCPKCGVRAAVLDVENALRRKINSLAMTEEALAHLESVVKDMMNDQFSGKVKAKEQAQKRLAGLEEQLGRLIHLHITNGIDRKRYDAKRADLEWRIIAARGKLTTTDGDKIDLISEFHRARHFLMDPGGFWHTATAGERCDTFPLFFDGPLQLHTNKKVGTVTVDGSNYPIWLPRLDSPSI